MLDSFGNNILWSWLDRRTRPAWIRPFVAWYWIVLAPIGIAVALFVEPPAAAHHIQQGLYLFALTGAICAAWGVAILKNRDGRPLRALFATAASVCMVLTIYCASGDGQKPGMMLLYVLFVVLTVLGCLELTRRCCHAGINTEMNRSNQNVNRPALSSAPRFNAGSGGRNRTD